MISMVKFRITGTSPLLQHSAAAMKPQTAGPESKKRPTPEEDAAAGAYRLKDGQLYIPSIAFRSALLYACKGKKMGKVSARSRVSATAFTPELECPLVNAKTGKPISTYEVDVRRVVIRGCGAVLRARPLVRDWACDLVMECDDDFTAPDQLLLLLSLAGRLAGVGDYRPERSGPMGRFTAKIVV